MEMTPFCNKHRGLWPGRPRGQAVEVMDCRMHNPWYTSCSLPHIAHVSQSKLGGKSRRGGNETESPDVIGAGLTEEKDC